MPLQVTYAGFKLHEAGIPHIGMGMQPDASGNPASMVETVRVQMRFFEEGFADNTAKWTQLGDALRANPRGLLVLTDEAGRDFFSRMVKWSGHDGAPEWGEFRREIALSFECHTGAGVIAAQSATFQPTGQLPITLPNVTTWGGGRKNERFSTNESIRREQMETIAASGKWSPPGAPADDARRDALLAKKAEIDAAADSADGTLAYRGLSMVMQIESLTCDIGDGFGDLTWSLSCFRRLLPDGTGVVADYQADFSDDPEDARRMTSVTGKVIADTEAQARAEAERIRLLYATGRIFLKQQVQPHMGSSPDGADAFLELGFTFTFREALDIVSFKLKAAEGTDTRTGDANITYSGSVVAKTSASALAKAREIGGAFDSGALFLMSRTEDIDTVTVNGQPDEFVAVTFSYTYLGKSAVPYAEVSMEGAHDFYGSRTTTVSGTASGTDQAAAIAFARQFRITGVLMLAERESDGRIAKGTPDRQHFKTVEFSYSYGLPMVRTTAAYGREIAHDYNEQTTQMTFSGTAFGPGLAECNGIINSIVFQFSAVPQKLRDSRTDSWKLDETGGMGLFLQMPFTVSYTMPITAADAASVDIIEAAWTVATDYGIWKTAIDEIPYSLPYAQTNVTLSCGAVTVSGSITARVWATAEAWARSKRSYATGHLDKAEVSQAHSFQPRSGSSVKHYTCAFSFASRDPELVWTD